VWIREVSLAEAFPRLFTLSLQREAAISEVSDVNGDQLIWRLVWRRRLFSWEEDLLNDLLGRLQQVKLSMDPDVWWWNPDAEGSFSVKSTYSLLCKEFFEEVVVNGSLKLVFEKIWSSPVPSKIIAFSWQLLHNRIPTRDNLVRCGVIRGDNSRECVLCFGSLESLTHLFLHCDFAFSIWVKIFTWLGVIVVMPATLSSLFELLSGLATTKKARKVNLLVWHTTIWLIWRARNEVIFNNSVKAVSDCVEEIKVLTWKWSSHHLKILPCLFYEWCWDPGICFNS
jgi:hypothetical protein